jgi:hypothetical protein
VAEQINRAMQKADRSEWSEHRRREKRPSFYTSEETHFRANAIRSLPKAV